MVLGAMEREATRTRVGASAASEGASEGATVAPGDADAPGVVDAEQAAEEEAEGLTDAAKLGIGGGVLAALIAGGVFYYRRSLA